MGGRTSNLDRAGGWCRRPAAGARWVGWAGLGALATALLAGCTPGLPSLYGRPATAASAEARWTPPAEQPGPERPVWPEVPPELMTRKQAWSLADLVDLALRNNPATRIAWHEARAAAAAYGVQRGAYFPSADLTASVTGYHRSSAFQGYPSGDHFSFGPGLSLSYLLLDLGGRVADVERSRQVLVAADFSHNAVIQDTALQVELASYRYMAAKALVDSQKASLDEARAGLEVATSRREAGVATVSEELQARTALSRARLAFETAQGDLLTGRAALASALGLAAGFDFDVQLLPGQIPARAVGAEVQRLIELALDRRPDLAAARHELGAARAQVESERAAGLPALRFSADAGWIFLDGFSRSLESVTGTVLLQVPLFTGLSQSYAIEQAREQAEAARERQRALQVQIVSEVYTDFVSLETAGHKVSTAGQLVADARLSADVALERYQAGVGNILELLAAQAALADARTGEIQARLDWFGSLARLAHDTGLLGLPEQERELAGGPTPGDGAKP